MRPDDDFSMDWEVDAEVEEAPFRHRRGGEARRPRDPRHRPRPRGRGDLLARAAGAAGQERAARQAGRARRLQCRHQAGRAGGDAPSARRSTSRWSTPISRAARSTISSASRSRRCSGGSSRAPARPAACSRWRCGSSATAKRRSSASGRRNTGRSSRRSARRGTSRSRRASSALDGRKLDRLAIGNGGDADAAKRRLESSTFTVASVESKPQRRNPPPPFITSTLQQEAQRKLGFDASRTMQIAQRLYEGVDIGGEHGRPHHLHAHRRRRHRAGSADRRPPRDRARIRRALHARRAAPLSRRRRRTRRRRTRRSARPTCRACPPTSRASSITTRRASTS